jgi:hypothetical protein
MNKHGALLIFLLTVEKSWACIGCGQESFTPKMLLVGSMFALLPMSLAATIFWIVRKEMKANKKDDSNS